jgi:peroxiredoxin Q/BCP
MKLKVGDKAPAFSLQDQNNKRQKLSGYKSRWVMLYFYPKDDTQVCTIEAQVMTANRKAFAALNAEILGVSADTVESHKKFAEKHGINFPILADTDKKVINAYGVWQQKSMFGNKFMGIKRMSYLIDPKGEIVTIYESVRARNHAQQVLKDLRNA